MKPETKKVAKKTTKKSTKKITKKATKKVVKKATEPKKVKKITTMVFSWSPIREKEENKPMPLQAEIAQFVLPKLQYLRTFCIYHPTNVSYSEWLDTLDKMIFGMQFVLLTNVDIKSKKYKELEVKAIEGQVLFGKYFSLLF